MLAFKQPVIQSVVNAWSISSANEPRTLNQTVQSVALSLLAFGFLVLTLQVIMTLDMWQGPPIMRVLRTDAVPCSYAESCDWPYCHFAAVSQYFP